MLEDILKRVETGMTTAEDAEILRTYIQDRSSAIKPLPCPFCGSKNIARLENGTFGINNENAGCEKTFAGY